jgi:hypothetical protein
MQENSKQNMTSESDSKVDAIAAVVIVVSVALMMAVWVANH